jgi:hypothetical protein
LDQMKILVWSRHDPQTWFPSLAVVDVTCVLCLLVMGSNGMRGEISTAPWIYWRAYYCEPKNPIFFL